MAGIHYWSVVLEGRCRRRCRWLSSNGAISSDAAQALRLVSPEVVADRLQAYARLRGWPAGLIERFRLVPAPPLCARRASFPGARTAA
ncbi:MAG: hypothetical protein ACKO0M_00585 [Cyanobium sp.]